MYCTRTVSNRHNILERIEKHFVSVKKLCKMFSVLMSERKIRVFILMLWGSLCFQATYTNASGLPMPWISKLLLLFFSNFRVSCWAALFCYASCWAAFTAFWWDAFFHFEPNDGLPVPSLSSLPMGYLLCQAFWWDKISIKPTGLLSMWICCTDGLQSFLSLQMGCLPVKSTGGLPSLSWLLMGNLHCQVHFHWDTFPVEPPDGLP